MFWRPSTQARTLLIAALAVVALVLLAASISDLEFSEGYRLAGPATHSGSRPLRLPDNVLEVLLSILLLIAPSLMLVGVLYALYASGFRARALIWFLWVTLMVLGLYLALRFYPEVFQRFPRITSPSDSAVATPAALATGAAVELGELAAPPAPDWAEPMVAVGVALFVALGIVAGAWAVVQRLARRPGPIDDLAGEAQRALEALRAGADVRDTVMRCYFEMGRVLDEHYGLARQEAMTPREFEQMLAGVDLPRAQIERLTRLFELVRYGSHAASDTQEEEAMGCLAAIAASRAPGPHVPVESRL